MKGFILENYHLVLSKKLGWDDMLVQVAIPAIDRIISSFIWTVSERHGEQISPEEACQFLVKHWNSDQIFALLGANDDPNYLGSLEESNFINVREEVEMLMRKGFELRRINS